MIFQHWVPMIAIRNLSIACALLVFGAFVATSSIAQGEEVQSLIRQASKECRAAKTLRRSDLGAAKEHFQQYRQILNQARAIKPDLLDSPDTATARVLNFCFNVKRDLDRAEALPLFEQGLRECAEARIMISNAAFEDAAAKYRIYREQKEGALAISDSVLDVYENSYEVRLCDRLGQDIEQAKSEYQKRLRETASESLNLFGGIVSTLNQAERQCRGAQSLVSDVDSYGEQTVTQISNLSKESISQRQAAVQNRDQLITQGKNPNTATRQKIDSLLLAIDECQGGIAAGIKRVEATLAARSQSSGSKTTAAKSEVLNREFRQIVGAPADYPRRAIRRGIEGEVIVKFNITTTGDISDIEIVDASPEGWFERSVREAVSKYKFQPRIRNGQPVESTGVQRKIVFKLR